MVQVVCFGETLWDMFEGGKALGGAPLNVATHLTQLGINTALISKTGMDQPGMALKEKLQAKGVSTNFLQEDKYHPTGKVMVTLNAQYNASYDIVFPSAWDFIQNDGSLTQLVKQAPYFVYGSLSARSETSRQTLFELLELARLKIFDINLRSPHFSRDTIEKLIEQAHILKINEEELEKLGQWFGFSAQAKGQIISYLHQYYQLHSIIVTQGDKGAYVALPEGMVSQSGLKVEVVDTVGSGDAFLAAYISRMIQDHDPAHCLKFACATGALVASRAGANPDYDLSEIDQLIASNVHTV
ncbi:MAG: carbohydrate kinase family protein [Candidatus Cyclobacteriaceae bacterium M3_2C_046]